MQASKHPLMVIGAGANRKMTSNMVRRFVECTKIPWVESQMGKGVIDASALLPARRSVSLRNPSGTPAACTVVSLTQMLCRRLRSVSAGSQDWMALAQLCNHLLSCGFQRSAS